MVLPKAKHVVLTIFFLIILSVPIYWLINGKQPVTKDIIERRTLANFPTLSFQSFDRAKKLFAHGEPARAYRVLFYRLRKEKFQKEFEDASSDQFPLRLIGIQLARAIERAQIKLAYLPLPDIAIPADTHNLYVLKDGSLLFPTPQVFNSADLNTIDERLDIYKELIVKYPQINFYAYYIERIEWAKFNPLNEYISNADQGQGFNYFMENIPEDLTVGKLSFKGLKEYKEFTYRTDHHWNLRGILRGYDDIYQMLTTKFPDISPALNHEKIKRLEGIEFLGSYARQSLNPIEPDVFEIPILNLPPYKTYVNGKEKVYGTSELYDDGNYPRFKYQNHYAYFGEDKGLVESVFDTGVTRNLMIIGDSFDNPLHLMLGSHFHHVYSIDLRHYKDFSFSEFVINHPVSDVLFIGNPNVILGTDHGKSYPELIIP